MPFVKKHRSNEVFEVQKNITLMSELLKQNIPIASSCGGDGVCSKCVLKIIDGKNNLSKIEALELLLLVKNKFSPEEYRLSCQAKILGDIVVDAPYW